MVWKTYHAATQKKEGIENVKYKEDSWWLASDIQKEIRRRTGRYISKQKIGKIAKESGLRRHKDGYTVYHKKVIDLIAKHIKEYYA